MAATVQTPLLVVLESICAIRIFIWRHDLILGYSLLIRFSERSGLTRNLMISASEYGASDPSKKSTLREKSLSLDNLYC